MSLCFKAINRSLPRIWLDSLSLLDFGIDSRAVLLDSKTFKQILSFRFFVLTDFIILKNFTSLCFAEGLLQSSKFKRKFGDLEPSFWILSSSTKSRREEVWFQERFFRGIL